MRNIKIISKLALLALVAALGMSPAYAAIVKVENENGCQTEGLPTLGTLDGDVYCEIGGGGFSLAGVLNGSIGLLVGDSKTPKYNITNDTGAAVSELSLYYSGALAVNSNIDMQVGGSWFDACESNDGVNVASDPGCGSGDKTTKPEDGGLLPVLLTWSGGDGIGVGETFTLRTASFASAGQDAGCFSGTSDCTVVPVPAAAWLFGSALLGLAGIGRKRRQAA